MNARATSIFQRLRPTWGVAFVAFVALVYTSTLYKGIGGRVNIGDSAKFQFIGTVAGISHPPGNPLYLTISALFARVPLGLSPGTKATLLSAIFGVIAVACVYDALRQVRAPLAATVGAACLAFGPLFWGLSTEAEVYTLNAALLAGSVSGLARWTAKRSQLALATGIACFVIAFGNHLTIVAAIPALIVAAVMVHRQGALKWPLFVTGAVATVVTVSFYLYIPLRQAHAQYSELDVLTRKTFWEYITAKKFQGGLGLPTLVEAVRVRLPTHMAFLQKQWLWPVLLVLPFGAQRIFTASRVLGSYVLLAILGFFAFALVYDIGDADGFYAPITVLFAMLIGCAVPTGRRSAISLIVALTVLLAIPARLFVDEHLRQVGADTLEEMGDGKGNILFDMPDLVRRIPEGSKLALPCGHYGCMEVVNYFRFADPMTKRRRIEIVQLAEGLHYGLPGPPPKTLPAASASSIGICTIRPPDVVAMQTAGAEVIVIERPGRRIDGIWYPGVPITCSVPKPR